MRPYHATSAEKVPYSASCSFSGGSTMTFETCVVPSLKTTSTRTRPRLSPVIGTANHAPLLPMGATVPTESSSGGVATTEEMVVPRGGMTCSVALRMSVPMVQPGTACATAAREVAGGGHEHLQGGAEAPEGEGE